ncbi:MAG: metal ABC transporter substrate-binding protein [Candidatus Krumholzibacteria bacterium]|nr:metal ABC transporter substrate-binding protein [Candidatus Krumholzibacteria bacterium]MDP6669847.1 metal ABC transporter substrate-binding protein [Candidatus Krumholzibacteria bacterium]MDP6796850.1 metal ABC transporter substrate-binding protein [Candidatus Krumholzibacteria bacterium]MDP7022269.1 metal ABC transporter substrate-binding protein [Candidatus Krumholzibacteria bacterium]
MKKLVTAIFALLFLQSAEASRLHVVATLPEIASLAMELGGERVKVVSLARGDEDPHSIAAKPSHSRRLSSADLLVYNGLELEVGWLPLLLEGARNPGILDGNPGHLNLSEFIEVLEVPEILDRSHGDVHPGGNPHFTVDPGVYPDLALALSGKLRELDPDSGDYYSKRLADFLARWESRMEDWHRRLFFLKGREIVSYHNQWAYSARRFGFEILDHVENLPGIPPSPRHLLNLQERIREEGIPLLIYSDLVHAEMPERFASMAGCRALGLPQSVGSREGTGDLFDWFELWVTVLEQSERGK